MKKILAVIGSPNNEKSNTATMTRDFLEMVKQFHPDIEYEVLSLGDKIIQPCHGCQACMKTGRCVYKNDALPEIMQKMQESDFLILGSPVYENLISAQLKALFDRTFMWIHLVGLMGKPALTAITYEADGLWLTEKYLSSIMTMMGCIMVGHLRGIGKQPGCFPDREHCKAKYKTLAKKVAEILSGNHKVRPTILNHICFFMMKKHNHTAYEYQYWLDKGWFKLSFKKALQKEHAHHL
jgi:multimeric flavodoxin WrbA